MAFAPPAFGYDRAILYSPDGRLLQAEYAYEAVKRGRTAVGVFCQDGVVLAVEKSELLPLMDPSSIERLVQVDEHIGMSFAGIPSDARVLIDRARIRAQINRITYDEAIDTEVLTKTICDFKQLYTQVGGVRPFGVSFLVAGVDRNGLHLFLTYPTGAYFGYYAYSIGVGSPTVLEVLEKKYSRSLTSEEGIMLVLEALDKAVEGGITSTTVELGMVSLKTGKFRKFSVEEVRVYLERLKGPRYFR